jgi:hypothetical protein
MLEGFVTLLICGLQGVYCFPFLPNGNVGTESPYLLLMLIYDSCINQGTSIIMTRIKGQGPSLIRLQLFPSSFSQPFLNKFRPHC